MDYNAPKNTIAIAPETTRPILDELFDGARAANKRLSTVIDRLRRLDEKVFGTNPDEPSKPGVQTPPGAASGLREEIETLHQQLNNADKLLMQIERFI